MAEQLSLLTNAPVHQTFENFCVGQNGLAVQAIQNLIKAPGSPIVCVGKEVGCTHLLLAAVHQATQQGFSCQYIDLHNNNISALQGLETLDFVAIDNLQNIGEDPLMEMAVFHTYNRLKEQGVRLLIAIDAPPESCMHLPDLISRLRWGLIFTLQPLNREEKAQMATLQSHTYNIELPPAFAKTLSAYTPKQIALKIKLLAQTVAQTGKWPRSMKQLA